MPRKKTPTYNPMPLTGLSHLPAELSPELVEQIAVRVHDAWAREKLDQGWRFGKVTNPDAKTHANLVPYEELAESDKEYDRKTALQTLLALVDLGYTISPPSSAG